MTHSLGTQRLKKIVNKNKIARETGQGHKIWKKKLIQHFLSRFGYLPPSLVSRDLLLHTPCFRLAQHEEIISCPPERMHSMEKAELESQIHDIC